MNKEISLEDKFGKLCFINIEGEILIEAKEDFDTIYYPSNGLCQVEKDGRYGYMDERGELVIPLIYKAAYEFSENGLAFVEGENGLGGYIDDEGYELIANIYLRASEFTEYNLASVGAYKPLVKNNVMNLYINDRDEIIDHKLIELFNRSFSQNFSKVYRFKKGLALAVKREERKGLKSHRNDFIGNPKFKGYYNEEGFAIDIEYEVEINFNNMGKGDIVRLIKKELGKLQILDVKNNYLKLLWLIEPYGEPEEIEVEMYYLLDNGKLGDYKYYRVN